MGENETLSETWSVYMHINLINGKRYIGIAKNPEKRWKNGHGYHNQLFTKAIKKWGWNNFSHEILYSNLSREEACKLEIQLINQYRTYCKENGYNVSRGGDSRIHLCVHVYQFDLYANYLKEYDSIQQASIETGVHDSRIVNACKGKISMAGDYLWRYKDDIPDLQLFKQTFDPKGTVDKHYPIYEFDLNSKYLASYKTAWVAVKQKPERHLNNHTILLCCRMEKKSSKGSIWRFQKDVPDINSFHYEIKRLNEPKAVRQYDREHNYIRTYDSITEAARVTGVCSSDIIGICKHKISYSKGFIFEYVI